MVIKKFIKIEAGQQDEADALSLPHFDKLILYDY